MRRHILAFPRISRIALLATGLSFLSISLVSMIAFSETMQVKASNILASYWRTAYDILVRPPHTTSLVERQYSLIEGNFLTTLSGGISLDQYKVIQGLPGVEVAAPVAILGYYIMPVSGSAGGSASLKVPCSGGLFAVEQETIVDEGARIVKIPNRYHVFCQDLPEDFPAIPNLSSLPPGINTVLAEHSSVPFLIAAVDPPQEAALVQLDKAIIQGGYLADKKPVVDEHLLPEGKTQQVVSIPVLIHADPYVHFTSTVRIGRVLMPSGEAADPQKMQGFISQCEQPLSTCLQNLPVEWLTEHTVNSQEVYPLLIHQMEEPAVPFFQFLNFRPDPRSYLEVPSPSGYHGLTLERLFLAPRGHDESSSPVMVSFQVQGIFDVKRIARPGDRNWVPLGIYFPLQMIWKYDPEGHPVNPVPVLPSIRVESQSPLPPILLTTLEAARLIAGDDCISAIRVRVGGINGLTPEAQRKIEAVASEIHRKTGLDVDIMVGSSPAKVLVLRRSDVVESAVGIPDLGYVEEQWVQKNVTLSYSRRIQSGHLLLIAALLLTGGLFAADMAWADLLARQRVLALQKALGWRSASLTGQVLRRAFLVGLGAGLGGTALAAGALALARQPLPSIPWLVGIPLLVTGLSLLGSLYPALQAARVPPIPLLQMAGLRHRAEGGRGRDRSGGLLLPVRYALRGVVRRWSRSLLAGLTAALSAGLLVLLVGVVADRAGYLSGTLLGEYLLMQVEGYHWGLVGVGLALAAAGMGNSLLAGVVERRREIGVLKAVGWRTGAVAGLFLLEGAVLGLLGGAVGTALGVGVYLGLYRSVGAGLVWAVAAGLGVPVGVGVLAAAYPARVAAAVPPAEALRGE